MHPTAGAFAAVFIFLFIAHGIADHYIQTDGEAVDKGKPGWLGRAACAAHVVSYTVCTSVAVLLADWLLDLRLSLWAILAGQAISAVTHYWADRRTTLEKFCTLLGKGNFYRLGRPRKLTAVVDGDPDYTETVSLYHSGDLNRLDDLEGADWDAPHLGTGAYVLDQWWHLGWLLVAAVVTVAL